MDLKTVSFQYHGHILHFEWYIRVNAIYHGPSDLMESVVDPPVTLYMGRDKVESA